MQRLVVLFLIAILSASAQPKEKPLWLDAAPKQWNKPGASIPRARKLGLDEDEFMRKQCLPGVKQPMTPEARTVVEKGWLLAAETHDNRGIVVVTGMQDFDGMCRPTRYQDFVFVNGKYAGTLSPALMDSRSDAASIRVAFPDPGKVYAEFERYSLPDPLCCPSRVSEATYEIRDAGGKPVVALVSVRTRPTN